jgi:hypothetical protein
MKNPALFLFLPALLLSGCTPILKQLHHLEGTWQRSTKSGLAYEAWKIEKPNLMLGKGYEGTGPETTVQETLRLFVEDGKIIYEATVPVQNEGKPVRFPLVKTSGDGKAFIFENPAHDFPQRLVYHFIGSDSLHVRAEDLAGNGLDFGFRKMEK